MSVRSGDVVTLRNGDASYVVEPYPAADQFCISVVVIRDEETGTDRRLVPAEDVHPAGRE